MSSGRRTYFRTRTPNEVKAELRREEERTLDQKFEAEIAERLGDLLADANKRDTKATQKALAEIKKTLETDIEGTVDPIFGGSVRKHTFVNGISDVDTLMVLKDEKLRSLSPQKALEHIEEKIREALSDWEVSRGTLSIKLNKGDVEIQVLPAVKEAGKTSIPSATGARWAEINPEGFFRKLTSINDKLGGKVVPVIKLAKIINDQQPEAVRLSGYHLESLAIESFKNYSGLLNPKAMLEHLFDRSRELVLSPIKDSTGQSVHVDTDLGAANSNTRKEVAAALDRVYRTMKNADANRSEDQWLEPLGEE